MDTLLHFGGACKALGAGKVGGYLVTHGSVDEADTSRHRDFFTPATNFEVDEWPAKSAVYYHHALDPRLGTRRLSIGEMKSDEVGIWIEAQLALRDEWEEAIYALAEAGKLSWSSGVPAHLVERSAVKVGGLTVAHELKHWPLGLDASLTPTPADPRCDAYALKSLQPSDLKQLAAGAFAAGALTQEQARALALPAGAVKSMLGEYALPEMTMAAVRSLNDRLFCCVLYDLLYNSQITAEERDTALREAFQEFTDLALRCIGMLMLQPDDAAAMKADLKRLWTAAEPAPGARRSLAERTEQVLDDLADVMSAYRQVKAGELKSGRKLSAARRERLEAARQLIADLLDETEVRDEPPAETDSDGSDAAGMGAEDTAKALSLLRLRSRALTLSRNARTTC